MSAIMGNARLVLERVARDGSCVAITPRPADIHLAVTELDVARDLELALHGTHDDGARYALTVIPVDGGVLVRLTRDGERRWLARAGSDAWLPGLEVPVRAVVPRSWGSSALALATMMSGWPPTLPWHDAAFAPIHAIALDACAFDRCIASPVACMERLAGQLVRFVDASEAPAVALAEAIAELRRVGHDLWSLDRDPDGEQWGSDYMRHAEGQGLYLEVSTTRPVRVHVRFRETSFDA